MWDLWKRKNLRLGRKSTLAATSARKGGGSLTRHAAIAECCVRMIKKPESRRDLRTRNNAVGENWILL